MPEVTVCIPWRPTPDRIAAYERVRTWWTDHGYKIVTGDSNRRKPFNVAAARNNAVRKCSGVVIVADADTIPDETALTAAIESCAGMVVYPFDKYRYLTPESVDLPIDDVIVEREFASSVGGMFVTTTGTYWRLGGQDERFSRWGHEDNAFWLAADTLAFVRRISGTVYAFGHEADRDLSPENPGMARRELYRFAHGRPELMRELIPEVKV